MLDPGLTDESGKIIRRSVADQVQVYQYGHSDATQLGGNVEYNLLHMKGILLKGAKISVIGTFNNDPRSLLLNTEGAAVIQGGQLSSDFENVLNNAISKSHLWGSPEYHQIRSDPHLNFSQRLATEKSELFYRLLLKLHLSWLL
jgi:phosphatidylserine/phosphatidylglycerophosphate/cardiolipin synthase-like enzyme